MHELEELLKRSEMNLTLVIAEEELSNANNTIYILEVDTNNNAAGGRGGGFGSRRFKRIYGFKIKDKISKKIVESDDVDGIDIGYVTRLPVMVNDEEIMISCSIDTDMICILNERYKVDMLL